MQRRVWYYHLEMVTCMPLVLLCINGQPSLSKGSKTLVAKLVCPYACMFGTIKCPPKAFEKTEEKHLIITTQLK